MRESEGIESPRPGKAWKTSWSNGRKLYIRNVEAVGSNPITSTEKVQVRAGRIHFRALRRVP
jgi:hypothetical protein